MDMKKLNWNLDEYITYKQVSIYLFVISEDFPLYDALHQIGWVMSRTQENPQI